MKQIQKSQNHFTNYEGIYGNTIVRSKLAIVSKHTKIDRKRCFAVKWNY